MKYQSLFDVVRDVNKAVVIATVDDAPQYIGFAVKSWEASPVYASSDPRDLADDFDHAVDSVKKYGNIQHLIVYRSVDDPDLIYVGKCHIFSRRDYAAGYADGSEVGWYYDLYADQMIRLRRTF